MILLKKYFIMLIITLFITSTLFAEPEMLVTLKTKSYNGKNAPVNAVAIWVCFDGGEYCWTFGIYSEDYGNELKHYLSSTNGLNAGFEKELRKNHDNTIEIKWDCFDYYSNPINTENSKYEFYADFSEDSIWNPSDDYKGQLCKGVIELKGKKVTATADILTNEFFEEFTLEFNPNGINSIFTVNSSPDLSDKINYFYSTKSHQMNLTSSLKKPLSIKIFNLKGTNLIKTNCFEGSNTVDFDNDMTSGYYIFNVYLQGINNPIVTDVIMLIK